MNEEIAPAHTPEPQTSTSKVNWIAVMLYIALTFAISWAIWIGLRALGVPFTLRASIGMFGPALAALLLRLLRHEGFTDAGLRLVGRGRKGAGRMYFAAYLVPPALIAIGIGLALLTGLQHWAFQANLQALALLITQQRQSLPPGSYSAQQIALFSIIVQFALAFTFAIPINMIFTFGEEFGWRGYLLPRLGPLGGISAAIITGVFWGL